SAMIFSDDLVKCLEAMDVEGLWSLWTKVAPRQKMPSDYASMIAAMHMSRTRCERVAFKLRAYSHQWLIERGYPSMLPDELKPRAQRIYPVITPAAAIAVKSKHREGKIPITGAMSDAVMEAAADGKLTDDRYVRERMMEARAYTRRKLYGR